MNWHYSKNGQTRGPVDSAALGRLIQGGDLGGNDLVWREGWAEWRVLGQVEELAHHLQSNRKSTPPPLPIGAPGTVASAAQARTFAGIEFVWCPPGTFMMGTPGDEEHEIQHQVTLTRGFWIGKYPVTQAQWLRVMGHNPSEFRGAGLEAPVENVSWNVAVHRALQHCRLEAPVENVSWNDAHAFCSAVSRAEGIQLRLPTEAEWEYACRAGSTGPYCFDSPYVGDLIDYAWFWENSGQTTHPVGQKKPNGWGIHDMHGNVWEWCWDWYDRYPKGPTTDPVGPKDGSRRVNCGGGWGSDAGSSCRSASRAGHDPDLRFDDRGFRVAVSSTP